MGKYAITYDIGTTGVKTCIFELGESIKLVSAASEGYKLYVFPDGGAEQEPQEWWDAMCSTTKKVLDKCDVDVKDICGISFCSQMQGLVLVDKDVHKLLHANKLETIEYYINLLNIKSTELRKVNRLRQLLELPIIVKERKSLKLSYNYE